MEYVATVVFRQPPPASGSVGGSPWCWLPLPGMAEYQPVHYDAVARKYTVRAVWNGSASMLQPAVLRVPPDAAQQVLLPLAGHANMAGEVVSPPFKLYTHAGASNYMFLPPAMYRIFVDPAAFLSSSSPAGELAFVNALCAHAADVHLETEMLLDDCAAAPVAQAPHNTTTPPWVLRRQPRPAQLVALAWMQAMERITPVLQLPCGSTLPVGRSTGVILDLERGGLFPAHGFQTPLAQIRGGMLAGERGAGKTATVLALCAADSFSSRQPDAFLGARLLPCSASLVVVPRHLIAGWKLEMQACMPAGVRAIFLCDARDFKNVTSADILAANVVVCTELYARKHCGNAVECLERATGECVLLSAPQHAGAAASDQARYSGTAAADALALRKVVEHVRAGSLPVHGMPLHAFYWRRIIVDEALRQSPLPTALNAAWFWALQSDAHRVHRSQLEPIVPLFLAAASGGGCNEKWTPRLAAGWAQACMHVMPAEDASWPEGGAYFQDRIEWVELQPEEYMRYECARAAGWPEERLMRLVAGMPNDQPSCFAGPCSVHDAIVHLQTIHRDLSAKLGIAVSSVAAGSAEHEALVALGTQASEHYAYFQRTAARLSAAAAAAGAAKGGGGEEEACPVCLTEAPCMLAACGHTFCWGCTYRTFAAQQQAKCPMCRRALLSSHVVQISDAGRPPPQKVTHLRSLCRHVSNMGERCVVFAQSPSLVQFLAGELESAGLKVRALAGNTRNMEAGLRAFDAGELCALVVPMEACVGLTLTAASHVILFHGTPAALAASALSCVQRPGQTKHVSVYRILAKGTFEPSLQQLLPAGS